MNLRKIVSEALNTFFETKFFFVFFSLFGFFFCFFTSSLVDYIPVQTPGIINIAI